MYFVQSCIQQYLRSIVDVEIIIFLKGRENNTSISKGTFIFAETLSYSPGLTVCERNNAYIDQEYGVAFQWHTRAFRRCFNV